MNTLYLFLCSFNGFGAYGSARRVCDWLTARKPNEVYLIEIRVFFMVYVCCFLHKPKGTDMKLIFFSVCDMRTMDLVDSVDCA